MTRNEIVAKACEDYHKSIVTYIDRRINNHEDAEDLSQELFAHLLCCKQLICAKTIKSLLFTVVISNFAPPSFRKVERPIIRKVERPK